MSLGRKPSPGGETKVWRMLERMVAGPLDLGWRIRPTPSLLAEPSRPRAIMLTFRGVEGMGCEMSLEKAGFIDRQMVCMIGSGPGNVPLTC